MNSCIVLTPPGSAAISVVRLLGPATENFLRAHFSKPARAGRCVHGPLTDGEQELDDPVVVLLPDGRGADVNLHGGPWVVRSVLELARRAGFEPQQVSGSSLAAEAVDGRTTLEAEMLMHLPRARTELGLKVLMAQPRAWGRFIAGLADLSVDKAREAVARMLADESLENLLDPPRVAIAGAANVGKSTLANQLFGQERSITADLAGTTRDWVGEIADVNGLPVMLVDTPGLRQTDDLIELAAIERSRDEIDAADLILLVLDASLPLSPDQTPLLDQYPQAIRILNKADRARAADPWPEDAIKTVATTGAGVDLLREKIASHFGCADFHIERALCWTERQREELQSILT